MALCLPLSMTRSPNSRPLRPKFRQNCRPCPARPPCRHLARNRHRLQRRILKPRRHARMPPAPAICEGLAVPFHAFADLATGTPSDELSQVTFERELAAHETLPIGCRHPEQPLGPYSRSSGISNVTDQRKRCANSTFLSSLGVPRRMCFSRFSRFSVLLVVLLTSPSHARPCRRPLEIWPRRAWGALTPSPRSN